LRFEGYVCKLEHGRVVYVCVEVVGVRTIVGQRWGHSQTREEMSRLVVVAKMYTKGMWVILLLFVGQQCFTHDRAQSENHS
jgi:hypothetical protein